jgi:hypothetical protein
MSGQERDGLDLTVLRTRTAEWWGEGNDVAEAAEILAKLPVLIGETERLRAAVAERDAEMERLHSWDGLMSLLNEHYPEDVWPVRDDSAKSMDPGHRVLSLIRRLDVAERRLGAVAALADGADPASRRWRDCHSRASRRPPRRPRSRVWCGRGGE